MTAKAKSPSIQGMAGSLNQSQISDLFATSIPNISIHVSNILKEGELQKLSVIKDFLTTAPDGKSYGVQYYSLEMILAIGFRVHSIRGIQFRQWALRNLSEFLVKGNAATSGCRRLEGTKAAGR